jgi:hypothetical protein
MKKILMTSLVAIFAVSAAHAVGTVGSVTPLAAGAANNLAATSYVNKAINDQVGAEETARKSADGDLQFTGDAATATNLTGAINAIATAVGEIEAYDDTEVRGLISAEATARGEADTALDTRVTTAEGNITTIQGDITTINSALETKLEEADIANLATKTELTAEETARVAADGTLAFTGAATGATNITTAVNQIGAAITELGDTYATDDELGTAIAGEVARADAAYDAKGAAAAAEAAAIAAAKTAADAAYAVKATEGIATDAAATADATAQELETNDTVAKANSALQAADIGNKADKATTLAGYGITDAMTAADIDTALAAKANTEDLGALAALDTVTTAEITDGTITGADIANDTVGVDKFAITGTCAAGAGQHCVLTLNSAGTAWEYQIVQE